MLFSISYFLLKGKEEMTLLLQFFMQKHPFSASFKGIKWQAMHKRIKYSYFLGIIFFLFLL